MVSGLASSIRAATESATFDLAGQDASSIRGTVKDAFAEPLSLSEMIRITFVVGGGKLSRTRYDDKAGVSVTSTLKQLGYVEDRGASCVMECAGCYKTQHDTGKNVFTVVVFPRVSKSGGGKGSKHQSADREDYEPLIPTNSPGYKMAVCNLSPTFHNLLSTYCPTYMEKKECLRCIEGLLEVQEAIEQKMMTGQPLDSGEEAFYNEASELKEKHSYAQKEAHKHVDEGRLTVEEKRALVEMNEKRIEALMSEKSSASVAEKLKKALSRKQNLQSLSDDVLKMNSSYPPPLRYESQLNALRKKLLPLRALEEKSRGQLLTLAETRMLTEKDEIEGEIERLEVASCGWFEEEEAFEARVRRSRDNFNAKHCRDKRSAGGGGKSTASRAAGKGGAGAVNKWILPGEKPKGGGAWGGTYSSKSKTKGKGGAVFAAMMMDSSSDEEEESGAESEEEEEVKPQRVASPKKHPAAVNVLNPKKAAKSAPKTASPVSVGGKNDAAGVGKEAAEDAKQSPSDTGPKKGKGKKKKKSKASKATQQGDAVEVEGPADAATEALPPTEPPSTVSGSLVEFWRSFLLPFITAVISLLASLVTSMLKGKDRGGKKKRR